MPRSTQSQGDRRDPATGGPARERPASIVGSIESSGPPAAASLPQDGRQPCQRRQRACEDIRQKADLPPFESANEKKNKDNSKKKNHLSLPKPYESYGCSSEAKTGPRRSLASSLRLIR